MIYTTLQSCKDNYACTSGYRKLLAYVGLDYPMDKNISLLTILKSNGLADTMWVLDRAALGDNKLFRMKFGVWCAEQCYKYWKAKYPNDDRVKNCIDMTHKFIIGGCSQEELNKVGGALMLGAIADSAASAAYTACPVARLLREGQLIKLLDEHDGQ